MEKARDLLRKNFKRLRTERGLTAKQFGQILGLETNHIYRIESGRSSLSPEHIDKLCSEFSIEPAYFFSTPSNQNPTNEEVPQDIFRELLKAKDLSPSTRYSIIEYIRFQVYKAQKNE